MFRITVVFSLLYLCGAYAQKPNVNQILSSFIEKLDDYIQQRNLSEIQIYNIKNDFGFASVDVEGGSVRNLSSIELLKNSGVVKNDSTGATVSFEVGFDVLELHFDTVKVNAFIVNVDDTITVQAKQNSLSITLKFKQTNDKCNIAVMQAQTNLGDFIVTLKDVQTNTTSYINDIAGYLVEKVLNMFSSNVESFLNPQLEQTLTNALSSMDTSQMNLCQMVSYLN